jgi:hypothetical protein
LAFLVKTLRGLPEAGILPTRRRRSEIPAPPAASPPQEFSDRQERRQRPKATVDFRRNMLKRLTHTASTLLACSIEDKAAIARAIEARFLPLLRDGRANP